MPGPMVVDTVAEDWHKPRDAHRYENTVIRRSWHAVRDVAPEVQTLARALLNLRTKDPIGYVGTIPEKCSAFEGHGALKSVLLGRRSNDAALVGFFDDEASEEYFMVVNLAHGLNMSKMDGMRRLRLVFRADVEQIERLNRMTGRVETLRTSESAGNRRVLEIQLEGGTGDLFKWSNGNPWYLRPE